MLAFFVSNHLPTVIQKLLELIVIICHIFFPNLTSLYWNNDILSFTVFAHLEDNQIVYPPLGDISGFRCKKLDA